ncbi:MAG: glycoside hydrolase family 97 N-terminal domain-containing protein, partial [Planctomycetota bacterium]
MHTLIALGRHFAPACLLVGFALAAKPVTGAGELTVASPDERLVARFALTDVEAAKSAPFYSVEWSGKPVVLPSRLALALKGRPLRGPFAIAGHATSGGDATWRPLHGERAVVRDRYNQLTVVLKEVEAPNRELRLEFRAYDEGLALRYVLPAQPG